MKLEFDIHTIEQAFIQEDKRIAELPETENYGHDFVICTKIAEWLKETFFPDAVIMGYHMENNPTANTNEYADGHDFLVVNNRYIIDFWLKYTVGIKNAPVMLDMVRQPQLVAEWYGDKNQWE